MTWNSFGLRISVPAGTYTVQFKDVSGYTTPASQTATVTAGQVTSITVGEYVASGGESGGGSSGGGGSSSGGTITITGSPEAIPGGNPDGTYTYETGSTTDGTGAIFRKTDNTELSCRMTYAGGVTKLSVYSNDGCYMISEMPGYTLEEINTAGAHFGGFYWGPASGTSSSIDGMSADYTP